MILPFDYCEGPGQWRTQRFGECKCEQSPFRVSPGGDLWRSPRALLWVATARNPPLHAGPGGVGRSLSRRRRPRDGGRWAAWTSVRRPSRGQVVAFGGTGGGCHGTPTSPPTGQPERPRSAPRMPCAGGRPWAVRGVVRACQPAGLAWRAQPHGHAAQAPPATPPHRDYHARRPDMRRARHRWRARARPRPRLHPPWPPRPCLSRLCQPVNWPTIAPFKAGETRVASDSEFGDFTTLLVIRPDDSTRIELKPGHV